MALSQVEDLAVRRRGRGPGSDDLLETPQLSDPYREPEIVLLAADSRI
jgi:hypothetical protein